MEFTEKKMVSFNVEWGYPSVDVVEGDIVSVKYVEDGSVEVIVGRFIDTMYKSSSSEPGKVSILLDISEQYCSKLKSICMNDIRDIELT